MLVSVDPGTARESRFTFPPTHVLCAASQSRLVVELAAVRGDGAAAGTHHVLVQAAGERVVTVGQAATARLQTLTRRAASRVHALAVDEVLAYTTMQYKHKYSIYRVHVNCS